MNTARTSRRQWRLRTGGAALVAAIALAGCSPAESAQDTGSFEIGLGSAPNSLDITRHFDANAMAYISLFTEPLERLAGDGSLTPGLAEEVTQPDDQTIVYTLRSGVTFSNGEALTAEDVVWSFQHATDAAAGAQTAALVGSFESAEATGENEVTVTLSRPDPAARGSLALVVLVQESEFAQANAAALGQPSAIPIGTGPYIVASSSAEAVELERNEHYWGEAPVPDSITVTFFGTDDTAQLAMRSGSTDAMVVGNPVTLPQYESIPGVTTFAAPALISNFWSLDVTRAPFDDPHVRRAVAHALDREGLLRASFGDSARPLRALIPEETLMSIAPAEDVEALLDGLAPIEFDLDAARDELAQSSYPDGFELQIPVMPGWMELSALNMQENLRPLGITITAESLTPQQWTEMVFTHDTAEMFPMTFAAAIPDPVGLNRIVSEAARTQPGGYNFANWAPEDLQAPAAALVESTDDAVRFEAAATILTRISEEVPYIPMYQPDYTLVMGESFTLSEAPTVMSMASGRWIHDLQAG